MIEAAFWTIVLPLGFLVLCFGGLALSKAVKWLDGGRHV